MARTLARVFAVVDPEGDVSSVESTIESAIESAGEIAENVDVEKDPTDTSSIGELGADPKRQALDAFRLSGVSMIHHFEREVMSMLIRFLPKTGTWVRV
jgi:hypothetical protein